MPRKKEPPNYLYYKPRDCGYANVNGRKRYFPGRYNSKESREAYQRCLAEYFASDGAAPGPTGDAVTVAELVAAFVVKYVKRRYVKNGRPTTEQAGYRRAFRPVIKLYGSTLARDFGPLALLACRDTFVADGICRRKCNTHTARIVRCWKWGVSRQMVTQDVWQALLSLEAIPEAEMPDPPKIRAATQEQIDAVEPFVSRQIWAMIQLQLWTGCRPHEACDIRTCDIDRSGPIWEYQPESHKTQHHDKERVIHLGPHAQDLIRPWLRDHEPEAYIFQPREARAAFQAGRRAARKTPRRPGDKPRQPVKNPRRAAGEKYTSCTYGKAIVRACERAFGMPAELRMINRKPRQGDKKLPDEEVRRLKQAASAWREKHTWAPNQLRHLAATRIRAAYGIEASRIILGHSSAVTTEIYAEIDREKSRQIMQELG